MGKDKNKIRNNEEEIKMGENSIRKLVEIYSYNVVVDQFFMTTSKKIVEIDKILRNLKIKPAQLLYINFYMSTGMSYLIFVNHLNIQILIILRKSQK